LLLLAGCAGNGEGLDTNGNPISGEPDPLLPELQSIQDHVFTPICTACHVGAGAPLGFRLDADSSYAMLVNTPSVEVPSLLRVSPGHPDESYIIQKLEGHAAVGGQMPLGGPPLPQATIDVIRQWITDGAPPTPATASLAAATSLQAIAPLESQQLLEPPREILIAADGELDTSLLNSGVVTLTRSGGDGSFNDGNEVVLENLELTVRSVGPTVIALRVPATQWIPDRYELRLAGHGPLFVANRAGLAIDGAGTGTPGTDFVLTFTLEPSR
jgi:hemin uptake protein HemP